ncbi:hypothetical protein [Fluviicola sp.]|uniref:hypothetical protein n=1 Tax=Fluviicola sp. TaxID=1917219 RepID=UPI003D2A4200
MSTLSKRELKKVAYQMILKEGKSHQETFENLRQTKSIPSDDLAELVAKIPSRQKLNERKVLNYIFIGLLVSVILLRSLSLLGLGTMMGMDMRFLLVALFAALVVPGIGIYGAVAGKTELYFSTGILLLLTVIRTIGNKNFTNQPLDYVFFIPVVLAAAIAFYLPGKLKTTYKKTVEKNEVDGELKPVAVYRFEESNQFVREDLLDS